MGYSSMGYSRVLEYGVLEGTRCSALYETASSVYPEAVFVPFEEWPDVVGAIQAGTCRARSLPSPACPLALARLRVPFQRSGSTTALRAQNRTGRPRSHAFKPYLFTYSDG
jgi:hypothetical protein